MQPRLIRNVLLSLFLGLLFFTSLMAAAAPGDTDIIVKAHIPGGANVANAVIVQPDGKYLTAGFARFGPDQFSVTRYNADGTVDTAFADNGTILEPIGAGNSVANAIALQADGKIVIAGTVQESGSGKFAIARFDAAGHLDTSFGGGGAATPVGPGDAAAAAVAVQADGKIVVAGYATTSGGNRNFAVVRYTTGAALDPSFGSGGVVITDISPGDDQASSIALQADGKIVIGSATGATVLRYNSDGTLDTSFGSGGIATPANVGAIRAIALQSDGKIVLSGSNASGAFLIGRLDANGSLDAGFGTGGIAANGAVDSAAVSMAVQSDGKIVATALSLSTPSTRTAIVRLDSAGALDNTFGASGIAHVNASSNASEGMQAMAITADGRLILAGGASDPVHHTGDEIIARVTSSGVLDTTFNSTGFHQVDAGSMPAAAKATVLQPDGKIVVAGYVQSEATATTDPTGMVLARYNADGSLDTGFGTGGLVMPVGTNQANAVALQGDGKIVTAGFQIDSASNHLVQVARFNPDGTLDTSFGAGGLVNLSVNGFNDRGTGIAIQGDGKIVVGGLTQIGTFTDALAVRLTTAGALDPSFQGGKVAVPMSTGNDQANGIALQPDGKIVLAGSGEVAGGNDAFAAARLNTDGTLDSGFGTGGVVNTIIGSFLSDGFAVAIQGDGKIVVGGLTFNGTTDDFAVVRYATDGTLDTTFGSGGKAVNDLGNHNRIFALQMLADGKIAVAGEWAGAFTAGLYDANGTLDSTFGTGGAVFLPVNFNAGADHAFSLAIQPDGKWVLAGDGSGLFAWARLLGETGGTPTTVDPTVALASSANPSTSGQNVTFTATVSGSAGTATGTVNFMDGGTSLAGCSAVALSSGIATCSIATLADGPHSITADYSGDAAYNAATSNTVAQMVQANPVLTVAKAGSGTGTVTSSPAGINCGATCSAAFASGTMVSLSAAADAGSTFAGWSGGGCSGTGACSVTVSTATTVTATFAASTDLPRLGNISTRADVLTGENVVIGGFIIGGSASKTVVISGTGPSLASFGITNPLANPTLTLVRSSDGAIIASNDNWGDASNAADIQASGFAPSNSLESAIMMTLPPGAYTAILSGVSNGTGVGVVAVFEVDHPEVPLVNISTRSQVQTGNNVMIAGVIVQGNGPKTVVITATGPSLASSGIASPLANPTLTLVRSSDQSIVATNDNWQDAPNAADIQASGFAPSNSLESAIMVTLPPGAYTAVVSGVNGGTGVSVVGVFTAQ